MTLLHDKEKKKTFEIIKSDGNVNMENIKKLKILMGTKDYIKGQAKLKNGRISSFNPDENESCSNGIHFYQNRNDVFDIYVKNFVYKIARATRVHPLYGIVLVD